MNQTKKCSGCGTYIEEEYLDGGSCPDCGEEFEQYQDPFDDPDFGSDESESKAEKDDF